MKKVENEALEFEKQLLVNRPKSLSVSCKKNKIISESVELTPQKKPKRRKSVIKRYLRLKDGT
jgi:hypothetical protein